MSTETATRPAESEPYQEYISEFSQLISQQIHRLLIGIPLIAITLVQLTVVWEVLKPEKVADLANLLTFYGISIGTHQLIGNMLLLWMIIPTLKIVGLGGQAIRRRIES